MTTPEEYTAAIRKLKWTGLRKLWEAIKAKKTPEWEPGKAFEYLILRAFELDKAEVRWPFSVDLFDEEVEQIDGSLRIGGLYGLLESKDEADNITIAPVAKMRNQLMRRPAGMIGLVFASKEFTPPAVLLAHFTLPQANLLWRGPEVEFCLQQEQIVRPLERKYRRCVDSGTPDYDITGGDS